MKRSLFFIFLLSALPLSLGGCSAYGSHTADITVLYIVCALLSLALLGAYCRCVRKKDGWMILLFSAVMVVNAGYLALAVSSTLEEALLANRISYLGSVCLPLSMFMSILDVCRIRYKKALPGILIALALVIFLIAASPGYLDIYYKQVQLITENGVSSLQKIYGPLHILYLFYLVGYFSAMLVTIAYSVIRKKIDSPIHAIILTAAVGINICVWLTEQFIHLSVELLSVSYVVSELFLLFLFLLLQEKEKLLLSQQPPQTAETEPCEAENTTAPTENIPTEQMVAEFSDEQIAAFRDGLCRLTPTERTVYDLYVEGNSTKEILEKLNIKENTLKYHNKNIYGKLGVASRKQMLAFARIQNQK